MALLFICAGFTGAHSSDGTVALNWTSCAYLAPVKKAARARVIQPHFGNFSHRGPLSYGLDLAMKTNADILAMRKGVVVAIVDQFGRGKLHPRFLTKANYVILGHADGVHTLYAHLKKDSTRHQIGDAVMAGEKIGTVGCSGFCEAPHLHVEAFIPQGSQRLSLPIAIIDRNSKARLSFAKNENLWSLMSEKSVLCP